MTTAITAIGTANPAYKYNQKNIADILANLLNLNLDEKKTA